MKTKFGAIIVDGRGKIGGHVASKNRAGSYLRTKVTPTNPNTAAQISVRGLFTSFSQGWRGLTQAQRDAWNAAVTDYSRTDIFGDIRNPSGHNLYQRLNNVLATVGVAAMDTPPLPSAVSSVIIGTVTATVGSASLSIAFAPTVPADTAVIVYATAPMSAGKSFVKSEYRITHVLDAAATSPDNALADYVAKFGSLGSIGQKICFQYVPVNKVTGQIGGSSAAYVITAT